MQVCIQCSSITIKPWITIQWSSVFANWMPRKWTTPVRRAMIFHWQTTNSISLSTMNFVCSPRLVTISMKTINGDPMEWLSDLWPTTTKLNVSQLTSINSLFRRSQWLLPLLCFCDLFYNDWKMFCNICSAVRVSLRQRKRFKASSYTTCFDSCEESSSGMIRTFTTWISHD